MQNCVSSSITNGTKSPESPMIRPGFGPSSIDRCPCLLMRTCEKSILAEVGITQASFVPEVIKTFDQLLDLLLQKVTPHNRPVAMQTEREPTPPHPIEEFCSLRCDVHMVSHKQCTVAPESTTKKYSGHIGVIQREDRQERQSQALALRCLRKDQPCILLMRARRLFPPLVPGGID